MNDVVLRVSNLGKCFKIYSNPWDRAREWIGLGQHRHHDPFWSLRHISFEVQRGAFLGIIGENGAGKSTLLKIITGVLKPTEGSYQLNGKVLSLLELGTDFNFELSGRENAVYSAELLGFPKGYVQDRLEEIAEFSGLGEFFDRPMKLYSSGMKARLAFSLFAFLDCDVLILDEVLAVGDIFFQQKCYARLETLIQKQTTIILVTHQLATVQQYCQSVVLLDQGQQIFQGEPQKGILKFHQLRQGTVLNPAIIANGRPAIVRSEKTSEFFWPPDERFVAFEPGEVNCAALTRYAICNQDGEFCTAFYQGEQAYLFCEFELKATIAVPMPGLLISNKFNTIVHGKMSSQHGVQVPNCVSQGQFVRFCRRITLSIAPSEYVVGFSLVTVPPDIYKLLAELPRADFNSHLQICDVYEKVAAFHVKPRYSHAEHSYWGLCDMPGECDVQVVSSEGLEV